jgi:2-aminoadipate transaminase
MSIDQTSQVNIPPGVIDLGLGDPQFSLLPLDLLRRAAEERLAQRDPSFLQYGAEQGDGNFRLALADFLSQKYGISVASASLFITNGASGGLDLLCNLFTNPGDTIFVEEPSYFLALRIFEDHGLQIVPIQTDEQGLIIEALQEKLVEVRPKFIYVIPTFQNPSGHTLPRERREQLVALSQEYGFFILADEVYQFLSYTQTPPQPFAAYTHVENVVSLNSFSKILAPGLRLGWIQAHSKTIQRLVGCGLLDSGGGMNPFTSAIVRGVIEGGGLERNISKLIDVYSARVAVMDAALKNNIPQAQYACPHGGFFFWVRLPGVDTLALPCEAEAFKVNFRPGVRFSSRGGMREYLRLGISFYDSGEIEQGVWRLKQCLDSQ